MNYSLLILSPPASGHTTISAIRFAEAVCARGHHLLRVFFLDDGVYQGMASAVTPQDEFDHLAAWQQLSTQHSVELVLCISSALKRGLLDASEAKRYQREGVTVHPAFIVGGLGLLVDATANSDRVVTFGG